MSISSLNWSRGASILNLAMMTVSGLTLVGSCLLTGSASCCLVYPIWALLACFHSSDYGNTSLQYDQSCCNIHTSIAAVHLRFVRADVYSLICNILHVYVHPSAIITSLFLCCWIWGLLCVLLGWLFASSCHCSYWQIVDLFNNI